MQESKSCARSPTDHPWNRLRQAGFKPVYLSRRPDSLWDSFVITHHKKVRVFSNEKKIDTGSLCSPSVSIFCIDFLCIFYTIIESSDKPLCLSPSLVILF